MLNKCYLSMVASILIISQVNANTLVNQSTASIIAKERTDANLVVVTNRLNPNMFNTNQVTNLSIQLASLPAITTIRQIAYVVNNTANNLMVAGLSVVIRHTRLVIASND
jgi:uncharacterized protein (DUF4213/DUF364 family)